jgi:hypothetical protein
MLNKIDRSRVPFRIIYWLVTLGLELREARNRSALLNGAMITLEEN